MANISPPLGAKEPIPDNYLWSHSPNSFKNTQGLKVHIECTHGHDADTKSTTSQPFQNNSHYMT